MRSNKLKPSPDKIEVLLVTGLSGLGSDVQIVLDGVASLKGQISQIKNVLSSRFARDVQVTLVAHSTCHEPRPVCHLELFWTELSVL